MATNYEAYEQAVATAKKFNLINELGAADIKTWAEFHEVNKHRIEEYPELAMAVLDIEDYFSEDLYGDHNTNTISVIGAALAYINNKAPSKEERRALLKARMKQKG